MSRFATRDLATPEQSYWTRDWYREALERGQPVWGEPFFDQGGTERNVVRITVPRKRSSTTRHRVAVMD